MQTLKPVCEAKRTRDNGRALIYFPFYHDGEHKVFLNTQIAIPPMYWNKKTRGVKETLPANYGDPQKINEEIERLEKLARDLIKLARQQGVEPLGQYIKETFTPNLDLEKLATEQFRFNMPFVPEAKKKKEGFFKQLEDYIKSKEKKVKPATLHAPNFAFV